MPVESNESAATRGRDPFLGVTPPPDGREFRWSVGVRPLPAARWLEMRPERHTELAEKDQLFASARDSVFAVTDQGLQPSQELLGLVLDHLSTDHSHAIRVDANAVVDRDSGRVVMLDDRHPLEIASSIVAEDLCVLSRADNTWTMTAASVCFPSRWNLLDKIGRNLSQIHEPVPGYESRLAVATEQVFDRIGDAEIVVRANWTVIASDVLHLPGEAPVPTDVEIPKGLWLRVERQTIRALPQSGARVFTIGTSLSALKDLSAGQSRELSATLETVPQEVAEYKGWSAMLPSLVRYLADR